MRPTVIRLGLALAVAATIAAMQAWGWNDAAQSVTPGPSWLWRAGWPVVRVVVLPLAVGGVLYVTTGPRARGWWQKKPRGAVDRTLHWAQLLLAGAGLLALLRG
jgi:hypothetical protein